MAADMHPEPTIALINTTTPGPRNGEIEDNNAHGNNIEEITTAHIGGSNGSQDSLGDFSRRFELVDSIKEDFDLLWGLRKYLVMLGILAVSVTYNSGLTPPGGFWNKNQDGHKAGDPILRVEFFQRYEVFFYCNATAFAASLVLIILLLSKSVTRRKLWLRSMQFTMIVDLFSLMGAYAAGSCRALKSSIYIWVLVFSVFIYVWIHVLVSTMVPEALKHKVKTAVKKIRCKCLVHDRAMDSHQEKDIEEARKFILMLVTFAATVTYQAGLSPPGGFWAENDYLPGSSPPYKNRPATSFLQSHYIRRYNIFTSCNSTSFVASLVTIILLLSPGLSMHGIRSKAVVVCVLADLFGLIGAYAAGCCRDVATSFYVMFIIIIVLICIAFLAGVFVYKPVAEGLQKTKSSTVQCMSALLSSNYGSNRLSNAEQEGSHVTHHQDSVHLSVAPAEDGASEPEHQRACNQQVSHASEGEFSGQCPPAEEEKATNAEEAMINSCHPSQSTNTKDFVSELELVANTTEALSSTEHPSLSFQEPVITSDHMPAEIQHVVDMKEQSSTDDRTSNITAEGFSDQNGATATQHRIVDEGLASPVEASGNVDSAEEHTSDTEVIAASNDVQHYGNGHTDSNRNAHGSQIEKHLKKTRKCLLLLAILAVSLTYQSGLNPPGGFWSKSENNHSAGDRILEDHNHPRFIAFFYLNAVAFVASLVMIVMLLDRNLIKKITKHRELQIAMIVDLLSLTGSFIMGSCRETKKSISITVLVCLVLAYVAVHVLIAIHVIPPKCKNMVSAKLKRFWSALLQLCQEQRRSALPHLGHRQIEIVTIDKELDRRRNILLTLAILSATVTYQAGMSPPGGVWSDDSNTPGNPILQDNHPARYDVFYYSNSVSFVSSVVITILLVNKESFEHGIKSYALRVCLVVGLLGLLIAYAAGSCRNRKESVFLVIIAVAVLISLLIQILFSSMHGKLRRPLAPLIEFLQKWFFHSEEVPRKITSKSREILDCEEKTERKRHKYLMLIAILAASVTYQAGLNPPGGFWPDDKGHVSGNPVLHDINHERYKIFFCFNAISFMASIVVIMLLLSKSFRKKGVGLEVLLLIMILDLLALMTAFAAGSCRKFSTSVYVFVLVAGVVIYFVILIVLSRGIVKFLRKWKRSGRDPRTITLGQVAEV